MFPSTLWTLIQAAEEGEEAAFQAFVLRYRAPVEAYLARRGFSAEAEDLAQEVFLQIFKSSVLSRASASRGRFRSLIQAITNHVIGHHLDRRQAKKRGEGRVILVGDLEVATHETDDAFDREWMRHLIRNALSRLAKSYPHYHAVIELCSLKGLTREQAARELGASSVDVRNHLHRGKRKLIQFIREEVHDYSSSEEEVQEDLRTLSRFFPSTDP